MIGPHQGKELELMLAGKKHLAVFYEALIPGQEISELIIPEQAFASYVSDQKIVRIQKTLFSSKLPYPAIYVLFTLPGHEWRAQAFLWTVEEALNGRRPFDDAHEFMVGRLLDYTEDDICDFINQQTIQNNKKAASSQ